jgi:4-hydroxy-2-oxoheptanedioate aldolase
MSHSRAPFTLADRLYAGQTVFMPWIGLPDPLYADALAREDFDAVAFDMQHSSLDFNAVNRGITAVHHVGKAAIVRLALNDFGTGARLLDLGAECIIAPMINTVEDAKAFVSATKYPPLGERSWGGARVLQLYGKDANTYIQSSYKMTVNLAMIETRQALQNVEAILAVDGIDGVFAGPSDLSLTLSNGANMNPLHPSVDEAFATIMKAAKKANKLTGCFAPNPAKAKELAKLGWGLISVITDSSLIKLGAIEALKMAKG